MWMNTGDVFERWRQRKAQRDSEQSCLCRVIERTLDPTHEMTTRFKHTSSIKCKTCNLLHLRWLRSELNWPCFPEEQMKISCHDWIKTEAMASIASTNSLNTSLERASGWILRFEKMLRSLSPKTKVR